MKFVNNSEYKSLEESRPEFVEPVLTGFVSLHVKILLEWLVNWRYAVLERRQRNHDLAIVVESLVQLLA